MNLKIRPYKRGGWEVDIVLKFPSGEQWRERVRSPADSRAASKRWAEERASYVLANWQEVIRPKKFAPTLAEFEQRFLSEYPEANRQKPSTLEAKKSILKNHLVPTLGKLKLDEIGTAQVQKLKGKLSKRKPKTVNNVLNTLSVILRVAEVGRDRAHAVPHRAAQVPGLGDGVLRPRGAQAPRRGCRRARRADSLARAARMRCGTALR